MKYIVLYTILILGLGSLQSAAQKPSIDLLPVTSESLHPEALIDTFIIHDSLFLVDSISNEYEPARGNTRDKLYPWDPGATFRKRSNEPVAMKKKGLYPLFLKKLNPINFIIRFTALKF